MSVSFLRVRVRVTNCAQHIDQYGTKTWTPFSFLWENYFSIITLLIS